MRLCSLLFLGLLASCSCNRNNPVDLQSRDESVPAFDATPACVSCSQTETTPDCTPSRCAKTSDGKLCCVR
jgi:hypothetical protein